MKSLKNQALGCARLEMTEPFAFTLRLYCHFIFFFWYKSTAICTRASGSGCFVYLSGSRVCFFNNIFKTRNGKNSIMTGNFIKIVILLSTVLARLANSSANWTRPSVAYYVGETSLTHCIGET
jgi:hypothetical protein